MQLKKIINLAVENYRCRRIFAGDRLVSARQIDDRKPAHTQRHAVLEHRAIVVRPPMADHVAHVLKDAGTVFPRAHRARVPKVNESCDAAHESLFCRAIARASIAPQRLKTDILLEYILLMTGLSMLETCGNEGQQQGR